MRLQRLFLAATFCLLLAGLRAQQNNTENFGFNPPGVRWQKINAPSGRIIYPRGLDSLAFRIADIMAYQRAHDATIVGPGHTKKVPVVLQHLPVFPEGFSTPAPWRNEYFIIPPQNLFTGAVPWTDLLTVHEYRHTQQFHMGKGGFTWVFKPLLGQTGWLLNTLFNQPLWFREGDATVAETQLTRAGRGRMPRFHMETRAVLRSGYHYNYEKAAYGISLKNFVPNPYRYGYYMTAKLRRDKGDSIWQQVLHDTYHRGLFYSFKKALARNTGLSPRELYRATVDELDSTWRREEAGRELSAARRLTTPVKNNYTNYRFPHLLPDSSLVVLKDGFDEIRRFTVLYPDGKEQPLFSYGVYTEDHLMAAAEGFLLTWAEATTHPRWRNKTYSVIKIHDLQSRTTRKLTRRTRYFAPAPSPDGQRIAAVHIDLQNRASLVVLRSSDGSLVKELPLPGFIAQPRWAGNNREVVVVAVNERGNSLLAIDTETGTTQKLLGETTVSISRPFPRHGYIYFSAGPEGVDNIYALERASGQLYQVTSVRFGAYEPAPSPDGRHLVYSSYTAEGYQLEQIDADPAAWKKVAMPGAIQTALPYTKAPGAPPPATPPAGRTYSPEKFSALTSGLFNVYGWSPFIGEDQYGLEFLLQNIMNTLRGSVTPFYNTDERALGVRANLAYAALYPVIRLGGGYQVKRSDDLVDRGAPTVYRQAWREKHLSAGLAFPFHLTGGAYRTGLTLGGDYERFDIDLLDSLDEASKTGHTAFDAFSAHFAFSRLRLQARRQLQPRWGQEVALSYRKALDEEPQQLTALSRFYFPGIGKTHSFNLQARYKKEEVVNTYRFTSLFPMPRGYDSSPFEKLWVAGANYELPLWYPDMSLGGFAFLQQLKAALFYDHSQGKRLGQDYRLHSAGIELMLDLRLLRLFGMTMGVRYSHLSEKDALDTRPFQFLVTRFELQN